MALIRTAASDFVGEGPENKRLRALAHSLGVEQHVRFAGFCENSRAYYAAADLFLSASALDSLPNALIEAQAAALPAIAYPTAGIPEIIEDSRTGHLVLATSPRCTDKSRTC